MKEDKDPNYNDWDEKETKFAIMVVTILSIALIAKLLHYCSTEFISAMQ